MEKIKVWGLSVRVFHWLLVGLVGFSWYTAEQGQLQLHMYSGIAVLTLILFRIIWGFLGDTTARFSNFIKGPRAILTYVRHMKEQGDVHPIGHNPLGGWVVMLMLLLLLIQPILGLFSSEEERLFFAPLSDWVSPGLSHQLTELHEFAFNILLAVIAVHILAILFYRIFKKTDLILPMITGKKVVPTPDRPLKFTSPLWALVITGAIFALIWFLIVAPSQ